MTRLSLPIVLVFFVVTSIANQQSSFGQVAQSNATNPPAGAKNVAPVNAGSQRQASVSELVAMLQSVDPYHTAESIQGTVHVNGSTSMDAMAHIWSTGFREFHKDAKIEISAHGSKEAFDQLLSNPSSVAMLSHPVTNDDLTELKNKGLKEPMAFVVAREALAVFVHSSNPIQSITPEQLRKVFTVTSGSDHLTWGELGAAGEWADKPITVLSRTEESGTQVYLREFVFIGSKLREPKAAFPSNAEAVAEISKDPTAIAICGMKTPGTKVKTLALMAGSATIPSDDHAVLTSQYPLTRPMTLVIDMGQKDANAKAAKEFVHYALCQSGQAAALCATYYPVDLPLLRASLNKLQGSQLR